MRSISEPEHKIIVIITIIYTITIICGCSEILFVLFNLSRREYSLFGSQLSIVYRCLYL